MSAHLASQLEQQAPAVAFCRRCHEHYGLAVTTILSIHFTSGGVLTYFRCPLGHPDFYMGGGQKPNRRFDVPCRCRVEDHDPGIGRGGGA